MGVFLLLELDVGFLLELFGLGVDDFGAETFFEVGFAG